MRALLLIAGAALAVSGCSRGGQGENNQAAAASLTPQNIVSNDVTAIDAVTGDAANMAADVDMNFGNLNEMGSNDLGIAPTRSSRLSAKAKTNEAPSTTANTTAVTTATTNSQ